MHLITVQLQLDSYTKTLDSVNFASSHLITSTINLADLLFPLLHEYEQIISTQIYSVNDLMHPRRTALL